VFEVDEPVRPEEVEDVPWWWSPEETIEKRAWLERHGMRRVQQDLEKERRTSQAVAGAVLVASVDSSTGPLMGVSSTNPASAADGRLVAFASHRVRSLVRGVTVASGCRPDETRGQMGQPRLETRRSEMKSRLTTGRSVRVNTRICVVEGLRVVDGLD
jgi:hypothetical protein